MNQAEWTNNFLKTFFQEKYKFLAEARETLEATGTDILSEEYEALDNEESKLEEIQSELEELLATTDDE